MNIDDKIEQLKLDIGEEDVEGYLRFTFDYACEESDFLQLKKSHKTKGEYKKAFDTLCKSSRKYFIDKLYNEIEDLKKEYNPLPKIKLSKIYPKNLGALVHEIYYGKRTPELHRNLILKKDSDLDEDDLEDLGYQFPDEE